MRLYTFCNFYLSPIQQGVQSLHVLGELVAKYHPPVRDPKCEKFDIVRHWATRHKTVIILNGGNSAGIKEIFDTLNDAANTRYPYAAFCEDEQSLNGALTCCGVVIPEKIYNAASLIRGGQSEFVTCDGVEFTLTPAVEDEYQSEPTYNQYDIVLINLINSCGLAK